MAVNREYEIAAKDMLMALNALVHAAGEAITKAQHELSQDSGNVLSPEYMAAVQLRSFDKELKEVCFVRDRMYRALGIDADFAEEYRQAFPRG